MWKSLLPVLTTVWIAATFKVPGGAAFLVPSSRRPSFLATTHNTLSRETSVQPLQMMNIPNYLFPTEANHMLIATIDADINAMPDNEFSTVFMGGIVSWLVFLVAFAYWLDPSR